MSGYFTVVLGAVRPWFYPSHHGYRGAEPGGRSVIVIFVLVLFLENLRAGLIVASAIPLFMLFVLGIMWIFVLAKMTNTGGHEH